jgi:3-oxoacyl-[acyl-carrier-protein] synthase-3
MRNARIVSTGAYAPEKVVTNEWFNDWFKEDVDTWLRNNVQIYERRWCAEDESTVDLCEKAALQAMERANISADDLDLIIIATDTPEYVSPSTASVLQDRLGAKKAGTFDINTACAGFVTGLDVASKYIIADSQYQKVLVIGAYAMSKYLNLEDKKTATLFADGAGAVIMEAITETNTGFLASQLITEGQYHAWMGIYAGGTHQPVDETALKHHDHQLKFVKKFPKELNPEIWSKMALTLCEKSGERIEDVQQFFITQINIQSIFETMDRLGVAKEKAHTIMHYYGYTGSACIPMALNDAWEKNKFKRGDLLYFIGSGGGLAFASCAFRF